MTGTRPRPGASPAPDSARYFWPRVLTTLQPACLVFPRLFFCCPPLLVNNCLSHPFVCPTSVPSLTRAFRSQPTTATRRRFRSSKSLVRDIHVIPAALSLFSALGPLAVALQLGPRQSAAHLFTTASTAHHIFIAICHLQPCEASAPSLWLCACCLPSLPPISRSMPRIMRWASSTADRTPLEQAQHPAPQMPPP